MEVVIDVTTLNIIEELLGQYLDFARKGPGDWQRRDYEKAVPILNITIARLHQLYGSKTELEVPRPE